MCLPSCGETTDEQENDLVVITVVQRTGGGAERPGPLQPEWAAQALRGDTFRLRPVLRRSQAVGKASEEVLSSIVASW